MEERQQVQTRSYMFSEGLEGAFPVRYRLKNPERRSMRGGFRRLTVKETSVQSGKSLHRFLLTASAAAVRYAVGDMALNKVNCSIHDMLRQVRRGFRTNHFADIARFKLASASQGRSILHVVGRTVSSALIVPIVFQPHPVCSSSNFTPSTFGPKLNMYIFWKS
jgi:hypothetical protein